jgi:hypothetical protein
MRSRRFDRGLVGTQWAPLYEGLLKLGARNVGGVYSNVWLSSLAYFMHWCASEGVPPEFVDDEVITRYMREAKSGMKRIKAYRYAKALRSSWNQAVCVVSGWPAAWLALLTPQRPLPAIRGETIVSFADEDFHPELVAEVDLYCTTGGLLHASRAPLSSMTHRDRMALRLDRFRNAPPVLGLTLTERRPTRLGPNAIYLHRRLIFRTGTALYLAGYANIDHMRSIRDVITPQGAAALADSLQERHLENRSIAICISRFSHVARRCGIELSPAEALALRELWLDICPESGGRHELCERSLSRLAQFDDPDQFAMLIALPDVLMAEVEERRRRDGGWATLRSARQARVAVAIDILNSLPVRRRSLLSIDLRRNIIPHRRVSPSLIFYPDQVKTRRALEVRLSERTGRLISLYCEHYRPILPGADRSTLLFPGRSTKVPQPSVFADSVCNVVRSRLGVSMNMNLWRHLLATKVAEMREQTEDAGKLLGHAPSSRATDYYVRIGTRIAAKWLHQITDEVRPRGMKLLTGRSSDRQ